MDAPKGRLMRRIQQDKKLLEKFQHIIFGRAKQEDASIEIDEQKYRVVQIRPGSNPSSTEE